MLPDVVLVPQTSISSSFCSQEVHETRDQDTCRVGYCSSVHNSGHSLAFSIPGQPQSVFIYVLPSLPLPLLWHTILLCNRSIVIELDIPTQTRVMIINETLQNWHVYVHTLCLGGKGDSTYIFDKGGECLRDT